MLSVWVWVAFGLTAAVVCVDKFAQGDITLGFYMLMCTVGNLWLGFDNFKMHRKVDAIEEVVDDL